MEGPEEHSYQHYAYGAGVADWLNSTATDAHVNGSLTDDPTEHDADAFYRSYNPPSASLARSPQRPDIVVEGAPNMTTSRQRQNPPNGATQASAKSQSQSAARPSQRPSVRSASGPAPSTLSTAKSNPALPTSSRPPVKSLVQKFDSSANSSPATSPATTPRNRPPRTTPVSKSSTSIQKSASTSSPARSGKEHTYGSYKFSNLKPRERPQPAPVPPAASRKAHGSRQSVGSQSSGSKRLSGAASSHNLQSGRQPFFGEVVDGQDGLLGPGYGIANFDNRRRGSDSGIFPTSPTVGHSRSQSNTEASFQSPGAAGLGAVPPERTASAGSHHRAHSDLQLSSTAAQYNHSLDVSNLSPTSPTSSHMSDVNARRRPSPPSRIPLPTARRTSITSDSGSSIHSSSRAGSALGHTSGREPRPRGRYRPGKENVPHKITKSPPPLTLTSKRYAGPNKSANSGNSLKAVIHAPLQPPSPRLRHSRDRQPVNMATTSASRARSTGRHSAAARDQTVEKPKARNHIPVGGLKVSDRRALLEKASRENLRGAGSKESLTSKTVGRLGGRTQSVPRDEDQISADSPTTEHVADLQPPAVLPAELTLDTSSLPATEGSEPKTGDTDFEQDESPVLGMPGGFAMTPPLLQSSYQPLQQPEEHNVVEVSPPSPPPPEEDTELPPETFQQLDEGRGILLNEVMKLRDQSPASAAPTEFDNPSEIDDSESIQIMLRDTPTMNQNHTPWPPAPSHRVSIGPHVWRAEPLDSSNTISYLDDDEESPIDPFHGRASLRPEDSVSVVFSGNRDDRAPEWTPSMPPMPENENMTLDSEAYSTINRVLEHYHNSNLVTPEMAHSFQQQVRAVSPALAQHKDWDSKEATETYLARLLSDANVATPHRQTRLTPHTPEVDDVRASVDVNDLMASPEGDYTGTAIIYTQTQRYSRGSDHDDEEETNQTDRHYRPTPPPKDWRYSPAPEGAHTPTVNSRDYMENTPRLTRYEQPHLPEIHGTGEGLGLAINVGQRSTTSLHKPLASPLPQTFPPPTYPPPPPRDMDQAIRSPPSPSVYSRNPPSSIFPTAPPPLPSLNTRDHTLNRYQVNMDDSPLPPHAPPSIPASEASPKMAAAEEDDALSKRLKERRNRIKEILDTESIFLQDMMVVEDIYKATSTSIDSVKDEDRRVLFGNSADIVDFSRSFLSALKPSAAPMYILPKSNRWNFKRGSFSTSHSTNTEQSTTPEPPKNDQDRLTFIGAVFGRNMASLEKVFGDYLKNLDLANQRLAALQDKPKVKVWLEECHNYASDITQAWSLDSLLVKPLQRITRYPLLLDSLIATTPADHPDYSDLVSAKKELLAASVRINENKKRAELVDQVVNRKRKESDGRIPTGLSKAFGRRTEKLKVSVGITEHVEDQEYDALAQKFGGHFFQLQIVMRDVEKYMDDVQNYIDQCNTQVAALIEFLDVDQTGQMRPVRDVRMMMSDDYTEIESKWRKYGQIMLELTTIALPEHKAAIRKSVIDPIMTLWKLHEKPQKTMQKRKKRLPEYAKLKQGRDRGEKMDKKGQESMQQWEALNDSLKEQLPKLYALTKKLIERCLLSLINIQITWQSTCERKLQPILEEPPERTGHFSSDMQTYSQRFTSDYDIIHQRIHSLSVCNKTLMADISNFLSPAQTFVTDDSSSFKKPSTYSSGKRTQSLSSDASTPDISQRHSGNFTGWQQYDHTPPIDGQHQPAPMGRMRAGSAISSRGPSTPRSAQATTPAIPNFPQPQRPSTGAGRSATESTATFPRLSLDTEQRNTSGSGFLTPSYHRTSGVFSSALPMSDSPVANRNPSPEPEEEHHVLFLAASLFEFNIAHDRQEAGFPYLVYVPGEIFDVVALKGELWLARNQDDASHTIGWIWEKHFARILPDEA